MATIIVEDGSVVSGANSYASAADFTTYLSQRGVTLTGTYGDNTEILIKAMDFLEGQSFKGYKYLEDQPLQFPRADLYIDAFYIPTSSIPALLKEAQMEVAKIIDDGYNPNSTIERTVKSESVGDVSVVYQDNAAGAAINRSITAKLRKLLSSGSGSATYSVMRG